MNVSRFLSALFGESAGGAATAVAGALPVNHLTVSPATAHGPAGNTQQYTATVYDDFGQVVSNPTVTWASSNSAIATVSNTGLVTYVASGSVTITATCSGKSGTAVAMTDLDEITFLRANIAGADSGLLGMYSALTSHFATSSGAITQMDDARGSSGFGPSLTPTVTTGPALVGTGPKDQLIELLHVASDDRGLQTPAGSRFSLDTAKFIVYVGQATNISQGGPVGITDDAFTSFMYLASTSGSSDHVVDTTTINAGGNVVTEGGSGTRFYGNSKIRLYGVGVSGTTAYLWTPRQGMITGTIAAMPAAAVRLLFGKEAGVQGTDNMRAALVLNHIPSSAELQELIVWANAYHNACTGSSRLYVSDGDSITEGVTAAELGCWPHLLNEKSFYLPYDDINLGVSSAQLVGDVGPATALTTKLTTLVQPLYDGTRQKNVLMCFGGTNDIAAAGNSGATTAGYYQTYIATAKAQGWKVVIATPISRRWTNALTHWASQAAMDAEMDAFRAAIRANWRTWGADGMADLYADSRLSDHENATYILSVDGTHPTAAGAQAIADVFDPVVQAV